MEAHNKEVNWDPQTGNFELPGQNGNSNALYNSYNGYGNYQPRIGVAYQPLPKTIIRASYGLSSFMEGTGLEVVECIQRDSLENRHSLSTQW